MTKLLPLAQIKAHLMEIAPSARSGACRALISETLANIETLIRLEHDAHLREIRRLGT